jgi:hypothetical protein
MTQLATVAAGQGADTVVNQNLRAVSPAGLYGLRQSTTSGLILGYYGGAFNNVTVADGTVTLTASATNYVVAHRATGAVTAATTTTNWLNPSTYLQLYQLVAGASTFTLASDSDKRQAFGSSASGGGTVAGSDKQIQYNNAGAFGAEAGFEYDQTTNTMTVEKVTFTGLALTAASATGGAGFRLPHGAAPTTPTNGDVWTTTAGIYARINGATVGPLAAATGTAWGAITGTLASQTDLQAALDAKGAVGIPQNSQSAAYTLVLTDANKHIYHPVADTTARIWTIPANSSVAFPIGTAVTFDNDIGAGVITIAITTDTLVLVGTVGSTGSRTIAPGGQATAIKVTSTRWRINGTGLS